MVMEDLSGLMVITTKENLGLENVMEREKESIKMAAHSTAIMKKINLVAKVHINGKMEKLMKDNGITDYFMAQELREFLTEQYSKETGIWVCLKVKALANIPTVVVMPENGKTDNHMAEALKYYLIKHHLMEPGSEVKLLDLAKRSYQTELSLKETGMNLNFSKEDVFFLMVKNMTVTGLMESLKVKEQRSGPMVVNMKASGSKVNLLEKDGKLILMAAGKKVAGIMVYSQSLRMTKTIRFQSISRSKRPNRRIRSQVQHRKLMLEDSSLNQNLISHSQLSKKVVCRQILFKVARAI